VIASVKLKRRRAGDPLSAYLDQLSRVPVAGEQELHDQGQRLATARRRLQQATREEEVARSAAEYEAARQELVRSHLRLVLFLARPYARRSVSFIDLVQEGNLGLMQAADLFDPDRGCRFSTYAGWWIRNCILNALACHGGPVKIPVSTLIHQTRLRRTSNSLSHRFGRRPTVEEIAKASRVTMREARRAIRHSQPVISLNASFARGSDGSIADRTADPLGRETVWSDTQVKLEERIREAIGSLPSREQRILAMRFGLSEGEARSRRETAVALKVSPERIRQVELAALRRLRDPNRWRVPVETLF
jgi:RNA polymerase primary sigma factor